jgi:hypothetical protein
MSELKVSNILALMALRAMIILQNPVSAVTVEDALQEEILRGMICLV